MELRDAHKQSSLSGGTGARRRKVGACVVFQHSWGGGPGRPSPGSCTEAGALPERHPPSPSPSLPSQALLSRPSKGPGDARGTAGGQGHGRWGTPVLLGVERALTSFLWTWISAPGFPWGCTRKPGPAHHGPWDGERRPPWTSTQGTMEEDEADGAGSWPCPAWPRRPPCRRRRRPNR